MMTRKAAAMGKILVAIAVGIVFIVLCLGLYTLWKGGDTARTWSNKLMCEHYPRKAICLVGKAAL